MFAHTVFQTFARLAGLCIPTPGAGESVPNTKKSEKRSENKVTGLW